MGNAKHSGPGQQKTQPHPTALAGRGDRDRQKHTFAPVHQGLLKLAMDGVATAIENGGHAGLLFDKFFNQFDRNCDWSKIEIHKPPKTEKENVEDKGGKDNWLKYFKGEQAALNDAILRQRQMVAARHGKTLVFKTMERFVTGLGRSHPVENGFLWHPTLGVPYLPGSSVKGCLRNWIEGPWGENITEEDRAVFHQIFGSDFRTGSEAYTKFGSHDSQKGSVIFLDALPIEPVRLETDVMTPHYGPYYQAAGEVPGDWHDPVPIPFLTVKSGAKFQIALLPVSRKTSTQLERASQWLEKAITSLGAGAKTAVGYGRMAVINDNEQIESSPAAQGAAANWHGDDHPLLAQIKRAGLGEYEGFLSRIEALEDSKVALQCSRVIWHGFKKPEKKLRDKPGHWLSRIKAILESANPGRTTDSD